MNSILGLGKWMLAIPMLAFGVMHFMNADAMAGMAPFGGAVIIYITGLALILAAVAIAIGKYDKLASFLLGILLLLFIIPHVQMLSENEMEMGNILKNIALAGGAFMYASALSKDDSIIG